MATTNQSALDATVALTNALVEARKRIGDHLLVNPGDPDIARLENLKKQAGLAIAALTGEGIKLLGAETATALTDLKSVTERGKAFIDKIQDIKNAIGVVTSLLTLAASVLIGDAKGVLNAIGPLKDAIDT